jgi:CheY-like chemotaxis protein
MKKETNMVKPEEKTVLVVDDESDIVIYLQTLLQDAGFRVMTAFDGDQALRRVKEKKPDLISLDLVMPKKSGIRFFYELRKNKDWSRIPVIIVTGHARDAKVRAEMDDLFDGKTLSGPRTYLEKPVKPGDYVVLVKRELGIPAQATAAPPDDQVRAEAARLLQSADRDTLEAALKVLKEKQK